MTSPAEASAAYLDAFETVAKPGSDAVRYAWRPDLIVEDREDWAGYAQEKGVTLILA